jgi:aryl-alcohol dehydrogenase-like predicted oxidoreductase
MVLSGSYGPVDEKQSLATLHRALELGGKVRRIGLSQVSASTLRRAAKV